MKHNALLLILPLLLLAGPAAAERSISVVGEAHEDAAPDQAVISGQLVSRAKQLSAAKEANDQLVEKVVAIGKKFDIAKAKIAASNVYISPEYTYNNKTNKQEQVGYIVSRNLTITLDKLEIHEKVLSALVENGIDQVNNVSFGFADPEAYANKLRVKAVQDARSRAQMLADAAGAKLGKVISISMSNAEMPRPIPMMRAPMMAKAEMADTSVAPSLPGLSRLSESVSVIFELE